MTMNQERLAIGILKYFDLKERIRLERINKLWSKAARQLTTRIESRDHTKFLDDQKVFGDDRHDKFPYFQIALKSVNLKEFHPNDIEGVKLGHSWYMIGKQLSKTCPQLEQIGGGSWSRGTTEDCGFGVLFGYIKGLEQLANPNHDQANEVGSNIRVFYVVAPCKNLFQTGYFEAFIEMSNHCPLLNKLVIQDFRVPDGAEVYNSFYKSLDTFLELVSHVQNRIQHLEVYNKDQGRLNYVMQHFEDLISLRTMNIDINQVQLDHHANLKAVDIRGGLLNCDNLMALDNLEDIQLSLSFGSDEGASLNQLIIRQAIKIRKLYVSTPHGMPKFEFELFKKCVNLEQFKWWAKVDINQLADILSVINKLRILELNVPLGPHDLSRILEHCPKLRLLETLHEFRNEQEKSEMIKVMTNYARRFPKRRIKLSVNGHAYGSVEEQFDNLTVISGSVQN